MRLMIKSMVKEMNSITVAIAVAAA